MDVCINGQVTVRVGDAAVERQLAVAWAAIGFSLAEKGLALPVVTAEANPAGGGIRVIGARSLPGHVESGKSNGSGAAVSQVTSPAHQLKGWEGGMGKGELGGSFPPPIGPFSSTPNDR